MKTELEFRMLKLLSEIKILSSELTEVFTEMNGDGSQPDSIPWSNGKVNPIAYITTNVQKQEVCIAKMNVIQNEIQKKVMEMKAIEKLSA